MQIILDANVYISFAIRSKALKPLRDAYSAEIFTPLVSTYLLAEVENRPLSKAPLPVINTHNQVET